MVRCLKLKGWRVHAFAGVLVMMMTSTNLMGQEPPVIIAHRGASAVAPENTGEAIRVAIEMGALVIEFDVRETRDGMLVLFHDEELERTTGRKGKLASIDWEAFRKLSVGKWFDEARFGQERPITLEAAVVLCLEAGVTPLIERKSGRAESYAEILRQLDAVDRVIVQAFDWEFLAELKSAEPRLVLGALGSKGLSRDRMEQLKALDPEWVGWKYSDFSGSNLSSLQEAGFQVALWTVNKVAVARRWAEAGIDGIITDEPDVMMRELE
ncbi:MAG: glycerophosphodiester phosphodiesterase family protein [Verrucomicrobiota bacterium]